MYTIKCCFLLILNIRFSVEKPPTILFRHQLGPIAQSNEGTLIVYPGSILHMECLWIRRFGTPKWVVSHKYRWLCFFSCCFVVITYYWELFIIIQPLIYSKPWIIGTNWDQKQSELSEIRIIQKVRDKCFVSKKVT